MTTGIWPEVSEAPQMGTGSDPTQILEPADDPSAGTELRNDLFVESVSHGAAASTVCYVSQSSTRLPLPCLIKPTVREAPDERGGERRAQGNQTSNHGSQSGPKPR
jgi:hypothetical protein